MREQRGGEREREVREERRGGGGGGGEERGWSANGPASLQRPERLVYTGGRASPCSALSGHLLSN